MKSRGEILRAHYFGLMKKAATWAGLLAVMSSLFVAMPTSADQETSRSVTLSDSAHDATSVSYDVKYTNTTTTAANAVKSVRFQFCDNASGPLYNTSCSLPAGMTRGTGISVQTDNSTTFTNTYTGATNGSSDVLLTNATGNTFTAAHVYEFKLTGFTNPTAVGEFYVRIINCNDTTCTVGAGSNLSWGGFAVDTTNQFSVTANVQEDLKFCVADTITTPCTTIGSSSVTLAPNPLSTGSISKNTAKMAVSTNGVGGYTITCVGTSFTDTTADTIASAATTGTVIAAGTPLFGMTLRAQTSGGLSGSGVDPAGGTNSQASAPYNHLDSTISYDTSAGGVQVAGQSSAAPTDFTTYTILYAAAVDNLTKPGVYTAKQTYIATATF